jgi:hypothetical protein
MIIKCKRGAFKNDKILVKDNAGNEYYCSIQKDIFDVLPDYRPIEVLTIIDRISKKFVRSFLTFVRNV